MTVAFRSPKVTLLSWSEGRQYVILAYRQTPVNNARRLLPLQCHNRLLKELGLSNMP